MSRVEREDVAVETRPRHVGGQRGAGGDWRADESHRRAAVAGHLRRLVSRGRHLLAAAVAAAHACNATHNAPYMNFCQWTARRRTARKTAEKQALNDHHNR